MNVVRLAAIWVAMVAFALGTFAPGALAQTVSILPNAMTQFVDGNGAPYAGGHVYMYVPYTTTPKATWQTPLGTSANSNPITLDANGRAVIWGSGEYRQVLQDQFGQVVWDQLTYASPVSPVASGAIWYGTATGTANSLTLGTASGFVGGDGQEIGFIATATNTASATINASGFGSVLVEKNTLRGPVPLTGNEITSGNLYYATYSKSINAFVLEVPTTNTVSLPPSVVCDGATDNATALNTWFAGIAANSTVVFPGEVVCAFKSVLTLPTVNNITWEFNGSTLLYNGPVGSGNIVTAGVTGGSGGGGADCSFANWTIVNLTVATATVMIGGDGFRINDGCSVMIRGVVVGQGLNGNNNFYNGFHLNGGNSVYIEQFSFRGSHAGEIVNGDGAGAGSIQATDLFHNQGNIANGANVGLWIAGNCGGCYWDSIDVVGNSKNVLIDQSQVAVQNRQLRFGPNFASDGTAVAGSGIGVDIEDAGASGSQFFCEGCWISTASAICLNIGAAVNWEIHLIGARIENCPTAGVSNGSGSVKIFIDGGAIAQNGTGIFNNPSAGTPTVQFQARPAMYGNTVANETGLAPTISSGCGGVGSGTVTGDDQAAFVTWGAAAGTGCVLNYKTTHASSASVVSVVPQGVNVYGSLNTSSTTQLGITTNSNVSAGQALLVGVGGAGF